MRKKMKGDDEVQEKPKRKASVGLERREAMLKKFESKYKGVFVQHMSRQTKKCLQDEE